jgi:hypothetical protein
VPGVRGEGVRKKRWTIKLALCLLAGAVVTWGVAWGCAYWGPAPSQRVDDRATTAFQSDIYEQLEDLSKTSVHPGMRRCLHSDFGWPLRSLRGECTNGIAGAYWWKRIREQGGVVYRATSLLRPSDRFAGKLPARPLPLGFALNTLFYAAVVLGMVECVAFARRRVRRGKGRCPSCGYDRAGLAEGAACPECGDARGPAGVRP